MKRRRFLRKGLRCLAYVCGGAALAYPILSFIGFRKVRKRTVVFRRSDQSAQVNFKDGVFLVREGARLQAFSAQCTHLGCTVSYDETSRRFRCPCHGSVFSQSGRWISGPAGKNLISLPPKPGRDGRVKVEIEV